MGTDIHLVAEAKDDEGVWQLVPGPIIDCWSCKGTGIKHIYNRESKVAEPDLNGEECYWCKRPSELDDPSDYAYEATRFVEPGKVRDQWWGDRHYLVFALLGNQRNGFGFAGCYSHEPIIPLSDCLGFPDDLSADAVAWMEVRGGEHSASWVSLRDVLRYDYEQPLRRGGVVSLQEFDSYLRKGEPDNWCGDISGSRVRFVSPEVATEMVKRKDFDENTFTRITWTVPLKRALEGFIERMKMLAMTVGEHECRLVFDFDS